MDQSFALIPILFTLLFGCLSLVALGFWIWTLVDCVTNEPSEGNEKLVWVLIIVLLSWVGALVYVIVRRPQRMQKIGK